jgi:hypothetical protein
MWKGDNTQTCYVSQFEDNMTKIMLFMFCTNTTCITVNFKISIQG